MVQGEIIGTEEKARAKYAKLHEALRQGQVELIDGDGKTVLRDWVAGTAGNVVRDSHDRRKIG